MADDRSPRRRKRTFSTTSTISTDDYQDASEQIVEDISLEFFYKPRSITALACLFVYLVYSAFTRWGFYLHMSYFSGRAVLSSFSFATYTWISTFLNSKRNYEFLTQFFYVQIKKKIKWDSKSSFGWLSHNFMHGAMDVMASFICILTALSWHKSRWTIFVDLGLFQWMYPLNLIRLFLRSFYFIWWILTGGN